MRKTLWTVAVDDYAPDITALTFPLMRGYAEKIGADFRVVRERKFKSFPAPYEKMQLYELAKKNGSDWNIFFDADALIYPGAPDFTEFLHKDTVMHHDVDPASCRFRPCSHFRRDGRNVGSANWFLIASDWCLDVWKPLRISKQEALSRIYPTPSEVAVGITADHLLDDFTVSLNIAEYGIKVVTAKKILMDMGMGNQYFDHQYMIDHKAKVERIRQVLDHWKIVPAQTLPRLVEAS